MEQPARLYADIALMNRAFPHVFQTFSQEVWDLFHKITAQDRDGLIDSINDLSGYVMDRG
jgi:prephenate dehydrogenase